VEKINGVIIVIITAFILVCAAAAGGFVIGRADKAIDCGTGSELETAGIINSVIIGEQRYAVERIGRGIDVIERIRGIVAETDSAIGKLGELNSGSSGISAAIAKETEILENCLRDISRILDGYGSGDSP
jgi:hypothetical protein